MKKIFTLLAVCLTALAANAQFKIYVQADEAPYIWAWNADGDIIKAMGYEWPGYQLTEKITTEDFDEFWVFEFPAEVKTPIGMLFNNGAGDQTGDINGVAGERWFTYDGKNTWTDVSAEHGVEVPDAEVTTVTLKGNHNGWEEETNLNVIEEGKKFEITFNTELYVIPENLWWFKFRPNGQGWVGYWNLYYEGEAEEGKAPATDAPSFIQSPSKDPNNTDGNFAIDLDGQTEKTFTFTLTWGGGKDASENWSMVATAGAAGINTLMAITNSKDAPIYNLQGQRVDGNYRGIAIQNGRKVVVK